MATCGHVVQVLFLQILQYFRLDGLCFATDEDGRAVENFWNTLFKCIYNLHEEMFCLNVG
jgi:hypothetical protein